MEEWKTDRTENEEKRVGNFVSVKRNSIKLIWALKANHVRDVERLHNADEAGRGSECRVQSVGVGLSEKGLHVEVLLQLQLQWQLPVATRPARRLGMPAHPQSRRHTDIYINVSRMPEGALGGRFQLVAAAYQLIRCECDFNCCRCDVAFTKLESVIGIYVRCGKPGATVQLARASLCIVIVLDWSPSVCFPCSCSCSLSPCSCSCSRHSLSQSVSQRVANVSKHMMVVTWRSRVSCEPDTCPTTTPSLSLVFNHFWSACRRLRMGWVCLYPLPLFLTRL